MLLGALPLEMREPSVGQEERMEALWLGMGI